MLANELDPEMRDAFRAVLGSEPSEVRERVTVADGSLGGLAAVTGGDLYDVVLLHRSLRQLAQLAHLILRRS